jgi:hypothetical protein
MCTEYFHHIDPPTALPYILPLPTGIHPPRQDIFCPAVLFFFSKEKERKRKRKKEKRKMAFLFQRARQGISL